VTVFYFAPWTLNSIRFVALMREQNYLPGDDTPSVHGFHAAPLFLSSCSQTTRAHQQPPFSHRAYRSQTTAITVDSSMSIAEFIGSNNGEDQHCAVSLCFFNLTTKAL
jgi:hypothetical protein